MGQEQHPHPVEHHHHHHEADNYYLDQLCLVALAGAFGVVCVTLYYWQAAMLRRILAPQFHEFVLWSGVALLVLVVIRAIVLWQMAGRTTGHGHLHEHHHHHHDHEHGHDCGHEHTHDCGHEHHHDHEHAHDCGHEHTHDCGHDHSWAPWRYVVLLVPIMLYLLGLPASGPRIQAREHTLNLSADAGVYSSLIGLGSSPLAQLTLAGAYYGDSGEGEFIGGVSFKELEAAAYKEDTREQYAGKSVEVRGQFSPSRNSDRVFSLVRFRIQCCAADAIQLNVPMLCKESLADLEPGTWVKVRGRVEFRPNPSGSGFVTVVQVPHRTKIQEIPPEDDPYIQ